MRFPTYNDLYDACAKNRLRVHLEISTEPETPRGEPFLPAVPTYDPFNTKHNKSAAPEPGQPRVLSYVVRVLDGETVCCSGDLGQSIKSEAAHEQILRMSGVLVQQGRVRARDFPHMRSDPGV